MSAGFASAGSSKMLLDVVELLLVPGHFKNSTVNSLFIFNLIHANWVDGQVSEWFMFLVRPVVSGAHHSLGLVMAVRSQ
jgi:hypothetical protein